MSDTKTIPTGPGAYYLANGQPAVAWWSCGGLLFRADAESTTWADAPTATWATGPDGEPVRVPTLGEWEEAERLRDKAIAERAELVALSGAAMALVAATDSESGQAVALLGLREALEALHATRPMPDGPVGYADQEGGTVNSHAKPVRVTVEYLDGDGEEVRIRADLAGVPRRNDYLVLHRPGVRLRVVDVEWRSPRGTHPPEVIVLGELRGAPQTSREPEEIRSRSSRR
jgi:hypothetical protein